MRRAQLHHPSSALLNESICTSTRVRMLALTKKLGGSGGMLPQKKFLNLMLLDGFLGYFLAQNSTTNLCFSPGLVTGF